MKKVLILNNKIVDIVDEEFPVAEGFTWVDTLDGVSRDWVYNSANNTVSAPPEVTETAEQVLERKLKELKAYRDAQLEGGITLPNSMVVDTDSETRTSLIGARINAKEDPSYTVEWKAKTGWVDLNADTIIYIADMVSIHVQNCFSRERVMSETMQGYFDTSNESALRGYVIEDEW